MTGSWPDAARTMWAEFDASREHRTVRAAKAHLLLARQLAEMVPHLLDEISKRDVLLTRVRQLAGTTGGLYDRDPRDLVPVADILAVLDVKEDPDA